MRTIGKVRTSRAGYPIYNRALGKMITAAKYKKVSFTNDHFIQLENCIIEFLLTHSKDEIIANIVLHKHEIG